MSKTSNVVQLPADGSVQEALKRVHHATTNSYLVLGYTDGKNTLGVIAEGAGGLDDIKEHFIKDDSRYAILRLEHKIELSTAVKFGLVDWTPSSIKPLRRALLGTHKGQIRDLAQPITVTIEASDASDLDEGELRKRIAAASGTADNITTKAASVGMKTTYQAPPPKAKGPDLVPDSIKTSRPLNITNEDAVRAAIKAVRVDSDPTDWALVGYSDIKTLELVGSGSGGIDEMVASLNGDRVFYGFFRVTDKFDQSTTVKFNFFFLATQKMKPTEKALISTHRGFVVTLFEPYHNEFTFDRPDEITLDTIMEKVQSTAGTRSKIVGSEVREREEQRKKDRITAIEEEKKRGPQATKETTGLQFDDESALKATIAEVRKDGDTTWVLTSLEGTNKLVIVGSGGGVGATEVAQRLDPKGINFALIRLTDQIDASVTTKFVYVKYTAPGVVPTKKAAVTTLKGAIDPLFTPAHVDFFIESADELTHDIVVDKVALTSGSKSRVLGDASATEEYSSQ